MSPSDPLQPEPEMPEQPPEGNPPAEAAADPLAVAQGRIAALEAEVLTIKDQALRTLAEAENIRKRSVKERDDARKYAITEFARDLVSFADNFHRAIDAIPAEAAEADERVRNVLTGLDAMEREIISMLERHGVKKLRPMDEPFNPHFHEVMFEADGTGKAPGIVIQVIESGYVLNDRLLRPARVGIAKGAPGGGQVDQSA